MDHRSAEELEAGLDEIRRAPSDDGVLELIVRRPVAEEREVLQEAQLSLDEGVVGDNWRARGSRHTEDGSAEPGRQLTIMNARAIALFAGDRARWPEAGDQLYVDLDISAANLPAGTPTRHRRRRRRGFGRAAHRLRQVPAALRPRTPPGS